MSHMRVSVTVMLSPAKAEICTAVTILIYAVFIGCELEMLGSCESSCEVKIYCQTLNSLGSFRTFVCQES